MSGPLLHVGAIATCNHAGTAMITTSNTRVHLNGMAAVTSEDNITIAGCTASIICSKVKFKAASKVRIGGKPAVISEQGSGNIEDEGSNPRGPPIIVLVQGRVTGK